MVSACMAAAIAVSRRGSTPSAVPIRSLPLLLELLLVEAAAAAAAAPASALLGDDRLGVPRARFRAATSAAASFCCCKFIMAFSERSRRRSDSHAQSVT